MKKNYCNPEAQLIAMLSNDVITSSVVDDISDDIFGGVSNNIPLLK